MQIICVLLINNVFEQSFNPFQKARINFSRPVLKQAKRTPRFDFSENVVQAFQDNHLDHLKKSIKRQVLYFILRPCMYNCTLMSGEEWRGCSLPLRLSLDRNKSTELEITALLCNWEQTVSACDLIWTSHSHEEDGRWWGGWWVDVVTWNRTLLFGNNISSDSCVCTERMTSSSVSRYQVFVTNPTRGGVRRSYGLKETVLCCEQQTTCRIDALKQNRRNKQKRVKLNKQTLKNNSWVLTAAAEVSLFPADPFRYNTNTINESNLHYELYTFSTDQWWLIVLRWTQQPFCILHERRPF